MSNELKPLDSLIDVINYRIQENNKQVGEIENKQSELFKSLPISENEILSQKRDLSQLKQIISDLNDNNKIKQVFYMIDSIEIDYSKNSLKKYGVFKYPIYEFKDLTTNIGDKLPEFRKNPYVIPITAGGDGIEVFNVNSESFQADATFGYGNESRKKIYFNIMIIERHYPKICVSSKFQG